MQIDDRVRQYWQYEYDVSAKYLIPLLEHWGTALQRAAVIDVGCGEGGGLCALHDAGASLCCGFDIAEGRVEAARALKGARALELQLGNLYAPHLPFEKHQFDIVLLHDVFEHLEHKDDVLKKLASYTKSSGKIVITFPPYYSAYGAHQQLLNKRWAKVPFFHLIPFALSRILPRMAGERAKTVEEVQKLGRMKMGMKKFEAIVVRNRLQVEHKKAYIVSPNHIRHGLRPLPAGPLSEVPIIGEIVCAGVVYLLAKDSRSTAPSARVG